MVELQEIQDHLDTVSPGQPSSFTAACVPGDAIDQGDLRLVVVNEVPLGWEEVTHPKGGDRQLVPGNTKGSRHCLDSLDGVNLFLPKEWNEESLNGPCFVVTKERVVLHPVHGAVTIPAGFTILCRYQREYDKELKKERRARD